MGSPIIPMDLTLVSLKGQNRVIHILKELVKGLRYVTLVILNTPTSTCVALGTLSGVGGSTYLHTWGRGLCSNSLFLFPLVFYPLQA